MKTGIREYKLLVNEDESKIPETLKIHMLCCNSEDKRFVLFLLLSEVIDSEKEQTIVFCPTMHHCEYLQEFLKIRGVETIVIFGKMDQEARNYHMDLFRKKKSNILLVTDVAARGLDIPQLVFD